MKPSVAIVLAEHIEVILLTGGIILVKNDVRDVVASILLSRATMRKIKQNLFWAFIYNSIGIPVAAMALSSLSVIVNSALLKRVKLKGADA